MTTTSGGSADANATETTNNEDTRAEQGYGGKQDMDKEVGA